MVHTRGNKERFFRPSFSTSSFDADTDHPLFLRYVPLRTFEKKCHAERRIARQNPVEILSNPVESGMLSPLSKPDAGLHRFRQLFDVSNFSGKVADINPHQFCIGIFELSSTFIFIFISQQSPACVTHCLCCLSVPLPQVPGRRHFKPYMVSIWKHQMWPGFLGRFLRLNIFGFVEVKLKSRVFAIAVCLIHGVHRN